MNIVYLIGNGFDLNLGMKTKYEHFYEYYLTSPDDNNSFHVKKLKETIGEDRENWSDLEQALGNYLNQIKENEAVILHDHLIEHLSKYIALEEDKYILNDEHSNLFFNYLKKPHIGRLIPTEITEIEKYIDTWRKSIWNIKIITFNYTKSIEKIMGNKAIAINNNSVNLGHNEGGYSIELTNIEHVHGFTDKRMILGVNDVTQIANNEFHEKSSIIDRYIKSECNNTYGLEHDKKCLQWIKNANLLCLFGLSFGKSDKIWWDSVGEVLRKGCKIILYEYNDKKSFNANQGPHLKEAKENFKDIFFNKINIGEDLKIKIKQNIYVAYNTNMFYFDVKKKDEDE